MNNNNKKKDIFAIMDLCFDDFDLIIYMQSVLIV